MNTINCPVCGGPINIGELCPECGFDVHIFSDAPSETVQRMEKERIAAAKRIWDELMQFREQQCNAANPLGFLITDRLVVYCLYEGLNSLGAGIEQMPENLRYQNLLIPGIQFLPRHFDIEATKSDDGKKVFFCIKRMSSGGANVYVNTMNQEVNSESIELNSGDSLLFSSEPNTIGFELKFRKNITR